MKKNIVIVLLDGMRADRLGCYGYARNTSPCIDSLAKSGVICKNTYSVSNCSMPAYVSMFTGLYPAVHRATPTWGYYDGKHPFLVNLLQEAGYTTIGISNNIAAFSLEWGFIRGYDKYYRIGKVNNWFKESKESKRKVIKQAPRSFAKTLVREVMAKLSPAFYNWYRSKKAAEYYAYNDMGGQKAIEAFRQAISDLVREHQFPFFVFINIPETHHPYLPPALTRDIFGMPTLTTNLVMFNTNPTEFENKGLSLTSQETYDLNLLYDATVRYSDMLVEQIVQILKEHSQFENTTLVFLGDHGGMLNEKRGYLGSTCYTYEPEIRVPFIVANSGRECEICYELTSLIDVFPTVLDLADIHLDLTPQYHCKTIFSKERGHPFIVVDYPKWADWLVDLNFVAPGGFIAKYNITNRTMITHDGWKLVWRNDGAHELYNLKQDPEESHDLFWKTLGFSYKLIAQMRSFYQQLIGENGMHLEIYKNNSVGDDLSEIPAIEQVNPGYSKVSIINIPR